MITQTVQFEPTTGEADINQMCFDAFVYAQKNNALVILNHNGIEIRITPHQDPKQAAKRYNEELNKT